MSSFIISTLSYKLKRSFKISIIFGSNSIAITFSAFLAKIAVSVPNPGPISITVSFLIHLLLFF